MNSVKQTITGHIQEKQGRYYMVLNLYSGDKWKPKWISTGLKVKGNKRNAEAMLRETIQAYETAEEERSKNQAGNVPFTEYMTNWLATTKPQIEDSTYLGYRRVVEKSVIPYFEKLDLQLREVEPRHIKEYYDYLQVERKLTAHTVKHHHANIRRALQQAVIADYIPSNPADKVEKPRVKPFIGSVYNIDELSELFHTLEGNSLELPVMVAAYYGMRSSEVCGLRWKSIDFQNKTITVNHIISLGEDENGKEVLIKRNRTKNNSSYRTLPMIPVIEEKLLERKAQAQEYRKAYKRSYSNEHLDYVFTGKLGALLTPSNLSRYFREFLEKYGLRRIRYHDLRHSCASLLLANGIGMKQIQDWLGHSSYTTTANTYAHLDANSKNASADVIANVLGAKPQNSFKEKPQIKRKNGKGQKKKEPALTR